MKSGLILKGLLLTTLVAVIGISLKIFHDNKIKNVNSAQLCGKNKPLNQIKAEKYDTNRLKAGEATFYDQVSFKSKPVMSVVINPEALDVNKWAKVPPSAIKYIGKEDGWFNPDNFYLLEVPSDARGLALGKPCYGDGDAAVISIRKWKEAEGNKISINGKITLEHPTPLPKINPNHILVNVGSNQKDSLGDVTQVYFTKQRVRIPNK
ncbi:MAG: hypothetical protein KI793_29990 [Rivularia sp. (in: Bacteria)]|nr:hypothetical protein [Rivularia sp. MS3]